MLQHALHAEPGVSQLIVSEQDDADAVGGSRRGARDQAGRMRLRRTIDGDQLIRHDSPNPALQQPANVLVDLPPALGAAHRLMVHEAALRLVNDAPAPLSEAEAEIDVLVAVPVAFVEPSDFMEEVSPDHEGRPGDDLYVRSLVGRSMIGRKPVVAVEAIERQALPQVFDHAHPRML
ncbi:hypothetical protein D3C86_1221250 [compost metagenome]